MPDENKIDSPTYSYKSFKGHPIISGRGLITWVLIITVFYVTVTEWNNRSTELLFLYWFVAIGVGYINFYFMHYFEVSEKTLIIRHYYFFWILDEYQLSDITEIFFEIKNSRWPYSLRVCTKDYKSKLYPAATLWRGTWFKLRKELKSKGVLVTNQCIWPVDN